MINFNICNIMNFKVIIMSLNCFNKFSISNRMNLKVVLMNRY